MASPRAGGIQLGAVMKITACFIALGLVACFLTAYGMAVREHTIHFDDLQSVKMQVIKCISAEGNLGTYEIVKPSFEGFTIEDKRKLEEAYIKDFCKSL
jgi:hypothetical protein